MLVNKYLGEISVELLPEDAKQEEMAFILLRTPDKRYILGRKYYMYPSGIYKMFGGITDGNSPEVAAQRYLEEQLELSADRLDLIDLAELQMEIFADDPENVAPEGESNKTFSLKAFVYLYDFGDEEVVPRGEFDQHGILSKSDMKSMIDTYATLPNEQDTRYGFSWLDYGKIYGPIHEAALDAAIEYERSERVQSSVR